MMKIGCASHHNSSRRSDSLVTPSSAERMAGYAEPDVDLPAPVTYNPCRGTLSSFCSAKILSAIPGPLLLSRIFQTFGCFTRFVGILPISVHSDGTASFSLCSPRLLHTLVYTLTFIGTSSIYLPAAFNQFSGLADPAVYIAENLFIAGQLLGVVLTILQIPFMAKRFVVVWNGLRDVVDFMASHNLHHLYVVPYIRSRVAGVLHMIFMMVYAIICWKDFSSKVPSLDVESEPVRYWTHSVLLVVFFITCFFHLLPCMVYKMFAVVMTKSFVGLEELLEKRSEHSDEKRHAGQMRELKEWIRVYEKLRGLVKSLGDAMGFYILVEMVVLMTSVLMNVFTMLSQFQQRDALSTCSSFFSYSILLVVLTEAGEEIHVSGESCLKKLRDAAYLAASENGSEGGKEDTVLLHKISNLKPPKLSAAGFFTVNRKLAVGMASTFATYFVVIIQFKLNSLALDNSKRNDSTFY